MSLFFQHNTIGAFLPGTVVLGAVLKTDIMGEPIGWQTPKPIHHEPHWINPKKKAEAIAKGLDKMTAGVGYTVLVPIYRAVSSAMYRVMRNRARRKAMGRYGS